MYQKPLTIDSQDPICSATSLEGTVIGILFEKSGGEIKKAIESRVKTIDEEIQKKTSLIAPVKAFLDQKRKLLVKVEDVEKERQIAKEKIEKPFDTEISKLQEQIDKIYDKREEKSESFDDETCSVLKKYQEEFLIDWDTISPEFREIVQTLEQEKWEIARSRTSSCSCRSNSTISSTSNSHGPSISSVSSPSSSSSSLRSSDVQISRELKRKIEESRSGFEKIRNQIEQLVNEKRRLEMIARNIDSDRKFKLNLTQLSAFGFEDIEVK